MGKLVDKLLFTTVASNQPDESGGLHQLVTRWHWRFRKTKYDKVEGVQLALVRLMTSPKRDQMAKVKREHICCHQTRGGLIRFKSLRHGTKCLWTQRIFPCREPQHKSYISFWNSTFKFQLWFFSKQTVIILNFSMQRMIDIFKQKYLLVLADSFIKIYSINLTHVCVCLD